MCAYRLEKLEADCWYDILDQFQDATVFQTVSFGAARVNAEALEHLGVRRGTNVVGAAQIRPLSLPLQGKSIAYVLWGPLFHRRNSSEDWSALGEALNVLRREYVANRQTSVRVRPPTLLEGETAWRSALSSEGYLKSTATTVNRTIIV